MKTKAAVLYERNSPLKVEEITLDDPQGQELLVKLVATGLCHSDIHVITGDIPSPLPIVLGHEGAGIVEKVGPGVTTLQPGDHVVMMATPSCGTCFNCRSGNPSMCMTGLMSLGMGILPGMVKRFRKDDQPIGHMFGQGSFSEYTVVHESSAVKVREDAPLETAALFGCCVVTGAGAAIKTAGVKAGESIVVYGCGGVGLSAVMGAKAAGAGKIIGVSRTPRKLELAKELGADYVINAKEENPVQRVYEITGQGADYSIETSGNVDVAEQAFGSIRLGGKCVLIAVYPAGSKISSEPSGFLLGKILTGCAIGSAIPLIDIPRYVDMWMKGDLPIDKLITGTYSLDGINEAIEALEKGEAIRSIIRF